MDQGVLHHRMTSMGSATLAEPSPVTIRTDRMSTRADPVPFLLFAMTMIALLIALWLTRTISPLRGDSAEYLYFDPSRTVGYPAFLALVRLATGHVAFATTIQMIIVAGSLFMLGLNFYRVSGRPILSLVLQAILLGMPTIWVASASLMTEGLSTALCALWCAVLLSMIDGPSWPRTVTLIVISALGTMVRPSLVALFVSTAGVILMTSPSTWRGRALLFAAAGLLLAGASTPLAQWLSHGSARTTSPLARGVLQHTLYCSPAGGSTHPDAQFVEREALAARNYIATAPSAEREYLRRAYSTPLRFGAIIPVLGRRHSSNVRSDVDPYLFAVAAERVKANPRCYATSVIREYLRMTTFRAEPTAEQAIAIRRFMKWSPPIEVRQFPVLPGDRQMVLRAAREVRTAPSGLNSAHMRLRFDQQIPLFAVLPVRLLYGVSALVGLLSMLMLPVRRRWAPDVEQFIVVAIAVGIALHGVLAITAIVELSDDRYLSPVWPLVWGANATAAMLLAKVPLYPIPDIADDVSGEQRPEATVLVCSNVALKLMPGCELRSGVDFAATTIAQLHRKSGG